MCKDRLCLLAVTLLASIAAQARAAPAESLSVGKPLPRFDLLVPATRLYARYLVVGDQRQTIDIWRRVVSYEQHEGRRLLHVSQRWDGNGDKKYTVLKDSWIEPKTFLPVSHESRVTKEGKTTVSGFRFLRDRVLGMPELADNAKADFALEMSEPAYNFEPDIELLQTLPLARGYQARIRFYDPGLEPPAWYTYSVTGEDKWPGPDGRDLACWIVSTDSNQPGKYFTRFWIAKRTQIMLREQTWMPDGSMLVKTLLNGEGRRSSG